MTTRKTLHPAPTRPELAELPDKRLLAPDVHDVKGLRVRIWSNEHRAWWRPDGCGYTTEVERAGLYEVENALKRTAHCGPEKRICIAADGHVLLRRADFEHWYRNNYQQTDRKG